MFLLLYIIIPSWSASLSLGAQSFCLSFGRGGFIAPRAPNLDRSAIKEAPSEYFIGGRKEGRKQTQLLRQALSSVFIVLLAQFKSYKH